MHKPHRTGTHGITFGVVLGLTLSLASLSVALAQDPDESSPPDECAACHKEAYEEWQKSSHADSLKRPTFIEAVNRAGNPAYCRSCHATGYDPAQGTVEYEGVGCLACHAGPHGTINDSAELCGECHTGTHAPDYDQWLVSDHASANIECGDCHQDHSAELRMEDSTKLCQTCHSDMVGSSVHGQANIACIGCHMHAGETVLDSLSKKRSGPGHTFTIPPEVCASCHGMTHTISPNSADESPSSSEDSSSQDAAQIAELEAKAEQNLNLGLTGGGIGGLALGILIPWVLNRRNGK